MSLPLVRSRSLATEVSPVLSVPTTQQTEAQKHVQQLELRLGGIANIEVALTDRDLASMTALERTRYRLRKAVALTKAHIRKFLDTLENIYRHCDGSYEDFEPWRQHFIKLVESNEAEPDFNYAWKDNWDEIDKLLDEILAYVARSRRSRLGREEKRRAVKELVRKYSVNYLKDLLGYRIKSSVEARRSRVEEWLFIIARAVRNDPIVKEWQHAVKYALCDDETNQKVLEDRGTWANCVDIFWVINHREGPMLPQFEVNHLLYCILEEPTPTYEEGRSRSPYLSRYARGENTASPSSHARPENTAGLSRLLRTSAGRHEEPPKSHLFLLPPPYVGPITAHAVHQARIGHLHRSLPPTNPPPEYQPSLRHTSHPFVINTDVRLHV
ncbi:hypothetical protein JCM5353_004011 [Sporobolomyces roseus]